MNCLVYQPVGLGDIFWVQPIIDTYIRNGYNIWYPVEDIYRDALCTHMPKTSVRWVSPNDDYPLQGMYGSFEPVLEGEDIYLPFSHADKHHPGASTMLAKYYLANHPLTNWHKNVPIKRNREREALLIEAYGLFGDYAIVNQNYGTYPDYITRQLNVQSEYPIHYMDIEEDLRHGFTMFDWIGAFENADEIHTIETSTCYFIDLFCYDNEINMYERRRDNTTCNYYGLTNKLYRNPNWTFHVE